MTALKIMFASHWLLVLVPEEQASKFIQDWIDGKLPKVFGNAKPLPGVRQSTGWAVCSDDIVAMHTVDPQELQTMTPAQVAQPVVPTGISGRQDIVRQW